MEIRGFNRDFYLNLGFFRLKIVGFLGWLDLENLDIASERLELYGGEELGLLSGDYMEFLCWANGGFGLRFWWSDCLFLGELENDPFSIFIVLLSKYQYLLQFYPIHNFTLI